MKSVQLSSGQLVVAKKRLLKALERKGVPRKQLSSELSLSVGQLNTWLNLNDKRFPRAFDFIYLCRALEVDADFVITGVESGTNETELGILEGVSPEARKQLGELLVRLLDCI